MCLRIVVVAKVTITFNFFLLDSDQSTCSLQFIDVANRFLSTRHEQEVTKVHKGRKSAYFKYHGFLRMTSDGCIFKEKDKNYPGTTCRVRCDDYPK